MLPGFQVQTNIWLLDSRRGTPLPCQEYRSRTIFGAWILGWEPYSSARNTKVEQYSAPGFQAGNHTTPPGIQKRNNIEQLNFRWGTILPCQEYRRGTIFGAWILGWEPCSPARNTEAEPYLVPGF